MEIVCCIEPNHGHHKCVCAETAGGERGHLVDGMLGLGWCWDDSVDRVLWFVGSGLDSKAWVRDEAARIEATNVVKCRVGLYNVAQSQDRGLVQ